MKYTQVAADTFSKIQLNAGVLLTDFNPATGALTRTNIFGATGGGVNFTATPEYLDFGEDIDNVPNNTMEMKKLSSVTATMSGTFKAADTALAKRLIGAADVNSVTGKVTPRADLLETDFADVWWVGDYSDVNTGDDAGFIAIRLINALSTGGFQIQSNDNGKGDFAFEFTGHYSLDDITVVPYEIYVKQGGEQPDTSLSALTIGTLTLTPPFDSDTLAYTAATTDSTNTVTATATDSSATIAIDVDETTVTNGGSATWSTGENVLTVKVTNGTASSSYVVTVTKS